MFAFMGELKSDMNVGDLTNEGIQDIHAQDHATWCHKMIILWNWNTQGIS